ncbi:MAG: nucleotidyl transferase AbiEii/AbiGii toxin family protein [Acidimicrobiia bacterium]
MAEDELIDLETSLRRRVADLKDLGVGFALVGGLAVSVRAEPRLTRDADFVLAVADDLEAEQVVRNLVVAGYVPGTIVEQEATGRLATIRLSHPRDPGVVTDLLFASSGIEGEIVAAAEMIEVLPGLIIPVATIGHLIAMKLLARDDRQRPTDADDLRALGEVADEAAWSTAKDAVRAIAARGYNRGRDLDAALEELRGHGPFG